MIADDAIKDLEKYKSSITIEREDRIEDPSSAWVCIINGSNNDEYGYGSGKTLLEAIEDCLVNIVA